MPAHVRILIHRALQSATASAAAVALAACGATQRSATSAPPTTTGQAKPALPGTGKPQVTIGDKNFTEQFVLGELYSQALKAQGYAVVLNRNIGPTEVTIQALRSGRLDMYPEYVDVWNRAVAGYRSVFASGSAAYAAAQRYAQATGMKLLNRTPFSDTDAIGVTFNYSVAKNLATIADLRKVAPTLTLGAPPQFQQGPDGLLAVEAAYGFTPAAFKPLEIGEQYQALDRDVVQAADVNTTDAQLVTGNYTLLRDPRHVFGWGNVAPVVPRKVLLAEGPAFERTIDKVSALLTDGVMRQLNAAVDLGQQDPAMVARRFLLAHGLLSSG